MKKNKIKYLAFIIFITLAVYSCGDKFDISVFNTNSSGNITGDTVYVKLNPDWTGFNKPQDVIVGREPLIYVADTDNDMVVMMNLDGKRLGNISIKHPVSIAQDYKLNLIICAEFDTLGQTYSAVYKINLVAVDHQIGIAPVTRILPKLSDLNKPDRIYTGVTVFYDNSYLVARQGPNNSNPNDPDNILLKFTPGKNGAADSLNDPVRSLAPTGSGIKSVYNVSRLKSFNKNNYDIVLSLTGPNSFKVQWLHYVSSREVTGYQNNLEPAASDLMEPNFFVQPHGICLDPSGNIYVADTGKDSVYKYNSFGYELISFGGAEVFNQPYAVDYFDKILYVADTGNDRILRFILSTEIQ